MMKILVGLFFILACVSTEDIPEESSGNFEELFSLIDGIDDYSQYSNESSSDRCFDELDEVKLCLYSVVENHNISSDVKTVLFDKELVLSLLDGFANASCFPETNCTNVRVAEYLHQSFLQTGDLIYRYGFECIKKELPTAENHARQCLNMIMMSGQIPDMSLESFLRGMKLLTDCTISRFSCTDSEKYALKLAAESIVNELDAYMHPEKILQAIGASESDISKEELASILEYFTSFL